MCCRFSLFISRCIFYLHKLAFRNSITEKLLIRTKLFRFFSFFITRWTRTPVFICFKKSRKQTSRESAPTSCQSNKTDDMLVHGMTHILSIHDFDLTKISVLSAGFIWDQYNHVLWSVSYKPWYIFDIGVIMASMYDTRKYIDLQCNNINGPQINDPNVLLAITYHTSIGS